MTEEQWTQFQIKLEESQREFENRVSTENLRYQLGLNEAEFKAALENQQTAATAIPKLEGAIAQLNRDIANTRSMLDLKSRHQAAEFVQNGQVIPYEDVPENRQGTYKALQVDIEKLNQDINNKQAQLVEMESQLAQLRGVVSGGVVKPSVPGAVASDKQQAPGLQGGKGQQITGQVPLSTVQSVLKP